MLFRSSPFSRKATTEGVVRLPPLLGITTGSLPSITETHELVVPRSIPIIFPIVILIYMLSFFLILLRSDNDCAIALRPELL